MRTLSVEKLRPGEGGGSTTDFLPHSFDATPIGHRVNVKILQSRGGHGAPPPPPVPLPMDVVTGKIALQPTHNNLNVARMSRFTSTSVRHKNSKDMKLKTASKDMKLKTAWHSPRNVESMKNCRKMLAT